MTTQSVHKIDHKPDEVEMLLQFSESKSRREDFRMKYDDYELEHDPAFHSVNDDESGDAVCYNGPDCDHPFCPVHSDFVAFPTEPTDN